MGEEKAGTRRRAGSGPIPPGGFEPPLWVPKTRVLPLHQGGSDPKVTRRSREGQPGEADHPIHLHRLEKRLVVADEFRQLRSASGSTCAQVRGLAKRTITEYTEEARAFVTWFERHAGRAAVTVSIDRVEFNEPIFAGELVTCRARVNYVGRTSMEIGVEVYAENLLRGTKRHTNTCLLTFVAIDEKHRPAPVPPAGW